MEQLYTTCIGIGIIVPVITLLFGLIGDFFSAIGSLSAQADIDLNIGGVALSVLPTSLMSISAGILVFGGIGKLLLYTPLSPRNVLIVVMASVLGYLFALVIQNLVINKLKQVNHPPVQDQDILALDGVVVNTIVQNGLGVVTFATSAGKITYPARAHDASKIDQGVVVHPIAFDNKILVVGTK